VAILQGPVAVRHSIKKDEPIKEMLDNVVSGLMVKVLERYCGGDESKIPAIDYLGVKPVPVPLLPGAHVLRSGLNPVNVLDALLGVASADGVRNGGEWFGGGRVRWATRN
jgi:enoyl reductase-like protein